MSEKTGPCGFCGKSREEHWPGRMHTFVEPPIRLGAHDKECPYSEGNAPEGAVCHCAVFGGRRASPAEALIYEQGGYIGSASYARAQMDYEACRRLNATAITPEMLAAMRVMDSAFDAVRSLAEHHGSDADWVEGLESLRDAARAKLATEARDGGICVVKPEMP